jgi:hypothetical protein
MSDRYLPPVPWPRAEAAVLQLSEMAADLAALRQQNEQLRNECSPRNETVRNLRECMTEVYELRVEVDGARESERRLSERHQRAQDLLDVQLQQSLDQADGLRDQNAKLRTEVDRLKAIIENVRLAIEGVVEPHAVDEQLAKLVEDVAVEHWSIRTQNCLKEIGVKTLGDLVKLSRDDLLRTRNFGRKSLNELRRLLPRWGCTLLSPEPVEPDGPWACLAPNLKRRIWTLRDGQCRWPLWDEALVEA